ncbi:hypothetical protein LUA82_03445 [Neoehrlichia mikurensis]|nr:protein-disulfide reductase DsbD domain-containing protein [Neoehrlichia mikurensis]UTO55222.1 hypothetical protein LUA82_03445 [Neoehrlichia mikurensis]
MLHEISHAQNHDNLVNINFMLGSVQQSNVVSAGIKFIIKKGWHIYYKNPGDMGLPTTFTWQGNIKNFDIHWPAPLQHVDKINSKDFYSNIYTDTIIFPISFTIQDNKNVTLKINYAVCNTTCIPQSKTLMFNELPNDFLDHKILNLINAWKSK